MDRDLDAAREDLDAAREDLDAMKEVVKERTRERDAAKQEAHEWHVLFKGEEATCARLKEDRDGACRDLAAAQEEIERAKRELRRWEVAACGVACCADGSNHDETPDALPVLVARRITQADEERDAARAQLAAMEQWVKDAFATTRRFIVSMMRNAEDSRAAFARDGDAESAARCEGLTAAYAEAIVQLDKRECNVLAAAPAPEIARPSIVTPPYRVERSDAEGYHLILDATGCVFAKSKSSNCARWIAMTLNAASASATVRVPFTGEPGHRCPKESDGRRCIRMAHFDHEDCDFGSTPPAAEAGDGRKEQD